VAAHKCPPFYSAAGAATGFAASAFFLSSETGHPSGF